jgi:UDP-4-amino-4-deoxy-L-arabinose formyltransferase/UDP-glucuronic acid dehydrogenase (UDP-4-keto-hexauronic acid decarboxylating)
MKIAIIGRAEILFEVAKKLHESGNEISLIVTSKEAPEYKVTSNDYQDLANKFGCPYIYSPNVNEDLILSQINKNEIDIAVSINYTGVISQNVIALFKHGILNAHGGDLPRYRGNACQAWAIINGENKIGLCIHKMIGGELDSGDILGREYLKIDENTRVGMVYDWMQQKTPQLIFQVIEKLIHNPNYKIESQSSNPEDALRCYPRKPEDGMINWRNDNISILRLINASSEPFQGSFCYLNDKKIIIWRAELVEQTDKWVGVPGQIANINKSMGSVVVLCGVGKLKVTEIEIDGKRTTPTEVINSIRVRLK